MVLERGLDGTGDGVCRSGGCEEGNGKACWLGEENIVTFPVESADDQRRI